MIVLPLLILCLLCSIFIITGYAKASTLAHGTTVLSELLIVGAVFALLAIIVSAAKMYLWDMIHTMPPTMRHFW